MYLQAKLTFRGKNDGIVIFLTFGIMVKKEKKKRTKTQMVSVGKEVEIKARFSLLLFPVFTQRSRNLLMILLHGFEERHVRNSHENSKLKNVCLRKLHYYLKCIGTSHIS